MPETDRWSCDGIVCPYCDHTETEPESLTYTDDHDKNRECGLCGKTFALETHISFHWETNQIED